MASIGFSGGKALEAKLREIAKKAGAPGTLRVGFLEDAKYPDGTPVAMVAALNNFGTSTAPPRPFFTQMVAEKRGNWGKSIGQLAVNNGYDMKATLSQMGEGVAGQLQDAITTMSVDPLSPITVMLRGMKSHDQNLVVTGKTVGEAARRVAEGLTNYGASTKALNETGHMKNSVGYDVGQS
jgi:hypothetical protein